MPIAARYVIKSLHWYRARRHWFTSPNDATSYATYARASAALDRARKADPSNATLRAASVVAVA